MGLTEIESLINLFVANFLFFKKKTFFDDFACLREALQPLQANTLSGLNLLKNKNKNIDEKIIKN